MFDFSDLAVPGAVRVSPRLARDARGSFVKTLHAPTFRQHGLPTAFTEIYYSTSARGVIRGMHFQTPPYDHDKLVYCVKGRVLDAVVDLRSRSPALGQSTAVELDAELGEGVFIPRGCAHGFCTLTESATLLYLVTTVHAPTNDAGVRWDSVGVSWPAGAPLTSERDAQLPRLADFETPFDGPLDASGRLLPSCLDC